MNPTDPSRPRGRSKPMQPATEPEEVTFRETRQTDLEGLFEVRAATRENPVSRDTLAKLGITADSVAAGLSGGWTKGWVCEHGSRVVGFCTGDLATGEVLVLAVLPQYEGLGIGRKLLSLVVGQLSAARARRVWLAASSNPAVRSYGFYRALGWRATGERTGNGDEILVLGVTVHPVTDSEAAAASAVVNESFTELASRDWDLDARETFLAGSSPREAGRQNQDRGIRRRRIRRGTDGRLSPHASAVAARHVVRAPEVAAARRREDIVGERSCAYRG